MKNTHNRSLWFCRRFCVSLACIGIAIVLGSIDGVRSTAGAEDSGAHAPSEEEIARAIVEGDAEDLKRASGWLEGMGRDSIEGVLKLVRRDFLAREIREAKAASDLGTVQGRLADARGRGLFGQVRLSPSHPSAAELARLLLAGRNLLLGTTAADGSFSIGHVEHGRYWVSALVDAVTYGFEELLVEGRVAQVSLVLGECQLVAEVVDAQGMPRAGVDVLAERREGPHRSAMGRTGVDGRVTLSHLEPGRWICTAALGDKEGAAPAEIDLLREVRGSIRLRAEQTGWIVVSARGIGGGAAPGIAIEARRADGGEKLIIESSSTGEALFAVRPGRWVVSAAGASRSEEVDVNSGGEKRVLLVVGG